MTFRKDVIVPDTPRIFPDALGDSEHSSLVVRGAGGDCDHEIPGKVPPVVARKRTKVLRRLQAVQHPYVFTYFPKDPRYVE